MIIFIVSLSVTVSIVSLYQRKFCKNKSVNFARGGYANQHLLPFPN